MYFEPPLADLEIPGQEGVLLQLAFTVAGITGGDD
jgi:hypothetical protein